MTGQRRHEAGLCDGAGFQRHEPTPLQKYAYPPPQHEDVQGQQQELFVLLSGVINLGTATVLIVVLLLILCI